MRTSVSASQGFSWRASQTPPDVANAVREMFAIANETIKVIALPEAAGAAKQCVDSARSKALPTQNNLLQRPRHVLHKHGMDMVWHHHPGELYDAFAIKMAQRLRDKGCAILPSQET